MPIPKRLILWSRLAKSCSREGSTLPRLIDAHKFCGLSRKHQLKCIHHALLEDIEVASQVAPVAGSRHRTKRPPERAARLSQQKTRSLVDREGSDGAVQRQGGVHRAVQCSQDDALVQISPSVKIRHSVTP